MREEAHSEGKPHRHLVWLTPAHSLLDVIARLFATKSSMAPVLSSDPEGEHVLLAARLDVCSNLAGHIVLLYVALCSMLCMVRASQVYHPSCSESNHASGMPELQWCGDSVYSLSSSGASHGGKAAGA